MKMNLSEQLNRMKYLLYAERGQVLSESEVLKTYLGEQSTTTNTTDPPFNRNTDLQNYLDTQKGNTNYEDKSGKPNPPIGGVKQTTLDFTKFRGVDKFGYNTIKEPLGSIELGGENLNIYISEERHGFAGPTKYIEYIPPKEEPGENLPTPDFVFNAANQFGNNLLTPTPELVTEIQSAAKRLLDILVKVYEKTGSKQNILTYLGNGFVITGHADGSPPSIVNATVIADHSANGFRTPFNGIQPMLRRNDWLARNRVTIAYNMFINEIATQARSVSKIFNRKLINDILEILRITTDGGKTSVTVVNHLNQDGSANPNEIGPNFRRMEFKPRFNGDAIIMPGKITPARKEEKIKEGTKIGVIKLPIVLGDTEKTIDGIQLADENMTNATTAWWGVTKEEYDKLPTIQKGLFNGKKKVTATIAKNSLYVDNVNFGTLRSDTSGMSAMKYASNHRHIFADIDNPITRTINGITYYQVTYWYFLFGF